jgi:hypothetical protein
MVNDKWRPSHFEYMLKNFNKRTKELTSVNTKAKTKKIIYEFIDIRSSWENVNLDVCFYVLIAMPLQSQESLNRPVVVLEILIRVWTDSELKKKSFETNFM